MSKTQGIVAAGHTKTAEAAQSILREGGNAFDAALASMLMACVAEPVLASLGGGGFLLAHREGERNILYDFFAQTPLSKTAESEIDFYPITADFGAAQQEFHIGLGSIATPGMLSGLFAIHKDLCRLPLDVIIAPAKEAAREGVPLNGFQHFISQVVQPIIAATPASKKLHENASRPGVPAVEGDLIKNVELEDVFDAMVTEGEALFYQGELGQRLAKDCREQGGYLRLADLAQYQVERREPLQVNYHGAKLLTNPPPSIGGILIAFTLSLLEPERLGRFSPGSEQYIRLLAHAMRLTQQLRQEEAVDQKLHETMSHRLLDGPLLAAYRQTLRRHAVFSRGTTHISVVDGDYNFASMTLSNGEGSSYVLPGTGIMMNNMLGEEDINPHGFHQWPENQRIASMMSPTLVFASDGRVLGIGSGGSNRIRSAIVQVLINLLDFNMNLEEAVEYLRIHFESGLLNFEAGLSQHVVKTLIEEFPQQKQWPGKNLFFGGAHCVLRDRDGRLHGRGDSRRGGVYLKV